VGLVGFGTNPNTSAVQVAFPWGRVQNNQGFERVSEPQFPRSLMMLSAVFNMDKRVRKKADSRNDILKYRELTFFWLACQNMLSLPRILIRRYLALVFWDG
jgi:hypothetical protein